MDALIALNCAFGFAAKAMSRAGPLTAVNAAVLGGGSGNPALIVGTDQAKWTWPAPKSPPIATRPNGRTPPSWFASTQIASAASVQRRNLTAKVGVRTKALGCNLSFGNNKNTGATRQ